MRCQGDWLLLYTRHCFGQDGSGRPGLSQNCKICRHQKHSRTMTNYSLISASSRTNVRTCESRYHDELWCSRFALPGCQATSRGKYKRTQLNSPMHARTLCQTRTKAHSLPAIAEDSSTQQQTRLSSQASSRAYSRDFCKQ